MTSHDLLVEGDVSERAAHCERIYSRLFMQKMCVELMDDVQHARGRHNKFRSQEKSAKTEDTSDVRMCKGRKEDCGAGRRIGKFYGNKKKS